ncbi:MAG TPA: RsmG family class I SAM-dependent methyltransferase [Vicinamibacterales bacterium]|nr:RsmG family class I SAM-dependent methyltransferase [Vicinamibacterales bacterium]
MSREFQDRLARRARRAGVALTPDTRTQLETYFRLLSIWNGKINLTGFNLADPSPEAFDKLLIEPLLAARYVSAEATDMIDIGSGGGSPAIPMLLAFPRLRARLVEAKTRKSVFLREALRALEMTGSEVITARYEELLARPDLHEAHDLLTIRAVRIEPRVLMTLQAFVKPAGEVFLFRSGSPSPPGTFTPPLALRGIHALLDPQSSNLMVLGKRQVGSGYF